MSFNSNTLFSSSFLKTFHYETPFFLFSKQKILDNFKRFQALFPKASIYYAMKANSEPELLRLLASAGSGFEVASKYELFILQKLKVPPEKIIYGTAVKPLSHIAEFYRYGVQHFAFDSASELEKIAQAAPKSSVYCRVLVNDKGSLYRFSEKFGTERKQVLSLFQRAQELSLKPCGLSFHVGSQANDARAWGDALESLEPLVSALSRQGIRLSMIDLGGGYPFQYLSTERSITLEQIAQCAGAAYRRWPYQPRLIVEPGRAMVADTAVLVASVVARIQRTRREWLFLDSGVYNALYEALAFQGAVRYPIDTLRDSVGSAKTPYSIAGPTGDSWDVIARDYLLPNDIQIGERMAIRDVGAYSLVVASAFNGFPKPMAYFV